MCDVVREFLTMMLSYTERTHELFFPHILTYLSNEGDQMMLAQREHFDVLNDHHFVVILVEDRIVEQVYIREQQKGLRVSEAKRQRTRGLAFVSRITRRGSKSSQESREHLFCDLMTHL